VSTFAFIGQPTCHFLRKKHKNFKKIFQ